MSSGCERCQAMGHEMTALKSELAQMHSGQHALRTKLEALMMELEMLHMKIVESEQTIRVKTATNDELGKQIMDFHEKNMKLEAENSDMKRKVQEMEAFMKEM